MQATAQQRAAFAGRTKARSAPCLSTGSYRFTAVAVSDGNLLCYAVHVAVQRFLHLQRLVYRREHQLRVAVREHDWKRPVCCFSNLPFGSNIGKIKMVPIGSLLA